MLENHKFLSPVGYAASKKYGFTLPPRRSLKAPFLRNGSRTIMGCLQLHAAVGFLSDFEKMAYQLHCKQEHPEVTDFAVFGL